jgi:hypothetical protein
VTQNANANANANANEEGARGTFCALTRQSSFAQQLVSRAALSIAQTLLSTTPRRVPAQSARLETTGTRTSPPESAWMRAGERGLQMGRRSIATFAIKDGEGPVVNCCSRKCTCKMLTGGWESREELRACSPWRDRVAAAGASRQSAENTTHRWPSSRCTASCRRACSRQAWQGCKLGERTAHNTTNQLNEPAVIHKRRQRASVWHALQRARESVCGTPPELDRDVMCTDICHTEKRVLSVKRQGAHSAFRPRAQQATHGTLHQGQSTFVRR